MLMSDLNQPISHGFLVKIWAEEWIGNHILWRGHITHVANSERHYFEDLENVPAFIAAYLKASEDALKRGDTD